jgi:hypothetical protein
VNSPGAVHASGLIDVHHHIGSQGVTKRYPDIGFILAHAGAVPYLAGRVGIAAAMLADLGGAAPVVAEGIGKVFSVSRRLQVRMPGAAELLPEIQTERAARRTRLLPGAFLLRHRAIRVTALLFVAAHDHRLLATSFFIIPAALLSVSQNGHRPAKIESIAIE